MEHKKQLKKWVCKIAYFSSEEKNYLGFQKQFLLEQNTGLISIQSALENSLSQVANSPIEVFCAGRTDRGVHATGQVIHFETDFDLNRTEHDWVRGANSYLPPDIRILSAKVVPNDFHARHSAIARSYEYWIDNQNIHSVLYKNHALHHRYDLDIKKMKMAAECLLGEHDFSAFRSSECQAKSSNRCINYLEIYHEEINQNQKGLIKIFIQANAFLHHMVRNIVGSLIRVGDGREEPSWIAEVLKQKDRNLAGMTAPAHGLYLTSVEYLDRYKKFL